MKNITVAPLCCKICTNIILPKSNAGLFSFVTFTPKKKKNTFNSVLKIVFQNSKEHSLLSEPKT